MTAALAVASVSPQRPEQVTAPGLHRDTLFRWKLCQRCPRGPGVAARAVSSARLALSPGHALWLQFTHAEPPKATTATRGHAVTVKVARATPARAGRGQPPKSGRWGESWAVPRVSPTLPALNVPRVWGVPEISVCPQPPQP